MDKRESISKGLYRFFADGPVQRVADSIGVITDKSVFDIFRMTLIDKHGMKMPQEINDALTKKHLELNGKGK